MDGSRRTFPVLVESARRRFWPTGVIAGLAVILVGLTALALVGIMRERGTYHARIGAYRVDDPYRIVAYVSIGFADPVVGYEAREEATRVVLTIRARNRDFGPGTYKQLTASLATPVLVTFNEPLGERAIVDENGNIVPRTKQDPLCGLSLPDGTTEHARN
jgi:hypothetical protein